VPDGTALVGDPAVVSAALAVAGAFPHSPAARWAGQAQQAIGSCDGGFSAHGTDVATLPASVACNAADMTLAPLEAWRGDAAVAMTHSSDVLGRVSARLYRHDDGDLRIEGEVQGELPDGAWSLIDPADEPAGPGLLAADGALFQARLRTREGIDLASIVSRGAELDRMVKLRSKIFEGAVLDGTWEAAVYTPDPGQQMMPLVLALGVQHRGAAAEGMGTFVDELLAEWPIHRADHTATGYDGACLVDLNVLPELAPCYVVSEEAIVLAWNAQGLDLALASEGERWSESRDGAVVYLDRFAEADRRLVSRMRHHESQTEEEDTDAGQAVPYPADRLQLEVWRDGPIVRFAADVEGVKR